MSGFTPGPWRVVGREPTAENVRFGHWDVDGKSNVASSCTYHDARLIAAAPELLEALLVMTEFAEGVIRMKRLTDTNGICAAAREIIAKATTKGI